jgi:uncharacterized small protein (DUF1192 family)
MKFNFNFNMEGRLSFSGGGALRRAMAAFVLALACAGGALAADQASTEELRKQVEALQAEVARLKAAGGADERLAELERRIDLLAAEIETSRTGGAAEPVAENPVPGFGPAASKVYSKTQGVSIGGYGEAIYDNPSEDLQDGQPSAATDRIDLVRSVLYVGYKFNDRILFNSELEVEHATTGEGDEEKGEVSAEFAYLDFKPWERVGLRAGLLLMPVGFVNEMHEAPVFHGARRPTVETAIIPTTWRENGAGIFGETGPVQWRAYLVAGLSSEGFEASGIREGRQGGSDSLAESLAFTARADFTGVTGLLAGASIFTGNSGQGATVGAAEIEGRVTLFEGHAQYDWRGLQLRILGARTRIDDAGLINEQNGLGGPESIGECQHGWYAQAAFDVMTLWPAGRWSVTPFLRYEQLDTQAEVPTGFEQDPATDRSVLVAGVDVKPIPGVVIKADFQSDRNKAKTGTNRFHLAVGYLF